MGAITYHNKDVASKTIAETLKGKSLAVFGRPDLKIVDILPTNLPLTVKGTREKQPVIVSAVNLAKHIRSRSQSIQALAGILTFSDKVIDKAYKERIKEEMQMTQIGQMLIDEGIEKATEKLIRTMLLKHKTVEDIHNDTDIPVEVINRIKDSGIKD